MLNFSNDELTENFFKCANISFSAVITPVSGFVCPFGLRSSHGDARCCKCKDFRFPPLQVFDEVITCLFHWRNLPSFVSDEHRKNFFERGYDNC